MEGFEMFWTCIAGVYWSSNIATFQGISYPIGSMGGFTVYLPTWMIDVHGKLGKYTYREPSHGSLRGISYIYMLCQTHLSPEPSPSIFAYLLEIPVYLLFTWAGESNREVTDSQSYGSLRLDALKNGRFDTYGKS